jgi:hypothetical protein
MTDNDNKKQAEQYHAEKFAPREPTAEEQEIFREVARMIHGK